MINSLRIQPHTLPKPHKPTQDKIVLKKFSDPSKKIKYATHSRQTMIRKLNIYNGLQGQTTEGLLLTAVLQKWRCSG